MEPYYSHAGIEIYHGDCREVLPKFTDGEFDLVLTDPPFGVRDEDWDDMTERQFLRFSMAWLAEAARVGDSLVSFFASRTRFPDLCKMIYPSVRQLIWHKPSGSQYAGSSEHKMWYAYEPIAHCYTREPWSVVQPKALEVAGFIRKAREAKGLSRGGVDMVLRGKKTGLCYRWEEAACLPTSDQVRALKELLPLNGEFDDALQKALEAKASTLERVSEKSSEKAAEKLDVFTYRTVTGGLHPCEKPLGLIQDLLSTAGAEAKRILDPFTGSGTVPRACKDMGLQCVAIEEDERYAEIAANRLRQEVLF